MKRSSIVLLIGIALFIAAAVYGAVVFYGNRNRSVDPPAVTQSKASDPSPFQYATYDGDTYSFDYPADWTLSPDSDGSGSLVRTTYYTESGIAVTKGAQVTITQNKQYDSFVDVRDSIEKQADQGQVTNILTTTVAGAQGITYTNDADSITYHTVTVIGGETFMIVFQVAQGTKASNYQTGYDTIVSTFKVK